MSNWTDSPPWLVGGGGGGGGGSAAEITYSNSSSGLAAANVQTAVDEVAAFGEYDSDFILNDFRTLVGSISGVVRLHRINGKVLLLSISVTGSASSVLSGTMDVNMPAGVSLANVLNESQVVFGTPVNPDNIYGKGVIAVDLGSSTATMLRFNLTFPVGNYSSNGVEFLLVEA